MKQILVGIGVVIAGFIFFVGFIWLLIMISNIEGTVTNPVHRILFNAVVWILGLFVMSVMAYLIYLIFRQYTDSDMPMSELHKSRPKNPEFE